MTTQYVILVGGVGGNELYGQNVPLLDSPRLWLDPVALVAEGWRWLQLGADGQSPPGPLFPSIVGRGLLPAYYNALTDWVRQQGWVPVAYEQDWRLRRGIGAVQLAAGIRRLGLEAPVMMICHSRGGLIARAALSFLSAAERNVLVGRCVGLGVPHYGSWEAGLLLAGTNETALLLRRLIQGEELLLGALDLRGGIVSVIDTWPAVYELLPKPGAPFADQGDIDAAYDPARWHTAVPTISSTWLAAARTDWAALPDVPADVEWLDVVGIGESTAGSLDIVGPPVPTVTASKRVAGDGTVPAVWAQTPGHPHVTVEVSHGQMPYDEAALAAASAWLHTGSVG